MPIEEVVKFLTAYNAVFMLALGILGKAGVDFVLKRIDADRDYYKKIIEKRMAACDMIEKALKPFLLISYDDNGRACHNVLYEGFRESPGPDQPVKPLVQLHTELHYALRFTDYWVSSEVNKALEDLTDFIRTDVDPDYQLTDMQYDRDACIQVAQSVYNALKIRVDKAYALSQWEYTQINDVEGFLKRRHHINPHPKFFWLPKRAKAPKTSTQTLPANPTETPLIEPPHSNQRNS